MVTPALLLFLALPRPTTALTAENCCSLTKAELTARRGTSDSCPSTSTIETLEKCQLCPDGTCRVDYRCYCPGNFLTSSYRQDDCTSSFAAAWPASVGKEDAHWRSCAKSFSPPPPSQTSCCALKDTDLFDLYGTSPSCPTTTHVLSLSEKCQVCPSGTCRVGYRCYCPSAFFTNSYRRDDCADSFGSSYPASVGKEDKDWRSCLASRSPPPESSVSCCSQTEERLTAVRGTSNDCPSTSTVLTLVEKCQVCPPGTCRLGYLCYCPGYFLSNSYRHEDCEYSFESSWPVSASKKDLDWKSCSPSFVAPSSSAITCCALSEDKLTELRGTTNDCPSTSVVQRLSEKCQKCPPGTCRVGFSCYCPDYFVSNSYRQDDCEDSFGSAWPVSVGKEDVDWRSCSDLSAPVVPPPSSTSKPATTEPTTTTTTTTSATTSTKSKKPGSGGTSTTTNPPTSTTDSTTVTATTSPAPGGTTASGVGNANASPTNESEANSEKGSSGNSLSALEIAGIVAGIVSAIVAVLGGIKCFT